MKKILLIGWKDMTLVFRDRAALIMMLVAPFLLTLGLGFVTGRFSTTSGSGVSGICVALVDQDGGQIARALVDLFQSTDLSELVSPVKLDDPALARQKVDSDQCSAALIIPTGFSDSILAPAAEAPSPVQVTLYTNPTNPTSVGVVKTILEQFMSQVEVGRAAAKVTVTQLLTGGLAAPQDAARIGAQIGSRQAEASGLSTAITLKNSTASGATVKFDVLAYLAPGMALMFLMYTTSNGGRTLLAERAQGTLPRLLVSPTTSAQVLAGKVFGIYLSGVAQMLILIGGSSLIFGLAWGDPLAVVALVLAAVLGAAGWGLLIAAFSKTPGQAGGIGSAIMLTFGILGGSFASMANMPDWFQFIGKITPNAWGLDGFSTLAQGGALGDILLPVTALLIMGTLLFAISLTIINRRGIAEK
jgi:ABC-2 type transport system permease protein